VVGTAGRVMDHIRKGTLKLDNIKTLVLDEADEMLRMGFIDDVKWVLSHISPNSQRLLFSATIPNEISNIIKEYLREPIRIQIKAKTRTATTITQKHLIIRGFKKTDALERLLEVEDTDGILIFVRTKNTTVEIADELQAHGYNVAAINGDMQQRQREYIIEQFKKAKTEILVATDVVARGIDIEHISHVINYDLPEDIDSYIHRIGRTGRAGRQGIALSLVYPREIRFLNMLERVTKSNLVEINLPTAEDISKKRIIDFAKKVTTIIEHKNITKIKEVIKEIQEEHELDTDDLLAALTLISQSKKPFFIKDIKVTNPTNCSRRNSRNERNDRRNYRDDRSRGSKGRRDDRPRSKRVFSDKKMAEYKIAVGRNDGVAPRNIVGAIANEAGIDSRYICNISIKDNYTTLDLPTDMPEKSFKRLQHVWVSNKKLDIKKS